jgi:hypothetical protein
MTTPINLNPTVERALVGRAVPSPPLGIKPVEQAARWRQRALPLTCWVKWFFREAHIIQSKI